MSDLVVLRPVEREKLALRIMTIAQATDLWLGELARQQKAARTRDKYRRCLHKLADMYPHADVDEITPHQLARFVDQWQNHSASTLGGVVTCLKRFFKWLEDEKVIRRSPAQRLTRPRMPAPDENDDVITISSDDVDLLFAAVRAWDELLALSVLAYLGPRRQAAAVLRLADYDPDVAGDPRRPTIRFREKGSKVIVKPCPNRLAEVIDGAVAAGVYADADAPYLIPGRAQQRRKGDRDDRVIWKLVRRVAARAGVDTHVHALRAAFAVHFLEEKPGELVALQKLMGHRRMETTLVYLRRLRRRQAMETVRDLVWGDNAGIPQNAGELFEAFRLTEKEGFEPSFNAKPDGNREGRERGTVVPLDEALKRRVRDARGVPDQEVTMEPAEVVAMVREHARKHGAGEECPWCYLWEGFKSGDLKVIDALADDADGEPLPSDLPADLLEQVKRIDWGRGIVDSEGRTTGGRHLMELQTITEEREAAKQLFEEYRDEVRKPLRESATAAQRELRQLDSAMATAYKQLAEGVTLLRLAETMAAGGVINRPAGWGTDRTTALPKLAIVRADARRVYTQGISREGTIRFSCALTSSWRQLSEARQNIVDVDRAFGEGDSNSRVTGQIWSALTPTIPPRYRPLRLGGYHVLFEVDDWQQEPQPPGADPALLKHVGGDLWAVVATWDLTPLEAAVLGQR